MLEPNLEKAPVSTLPPIAPVSLRRAFAESVTLLRGGGIATPELDARLLLMAATGLSREACVRDAQTPVAPDAAARLAALVARRLSGEPISRILGAREFYGRNFTLNPATLDPRPDSEVLIETALSLLPREAHCRILDLGTGSGCLLVTLLAELPGATGLGIDLDGEALAMAEQNAQAHGVGARARFVQGDWFGPVGGVFDVIVANPPYISSQEIAALPREVREHDPLLALDGGADGLDAYRRIVPELVERLVPGGYALLEIGHDQAEAVQGLVQAAGLGLPERASRRDLAGLPRCILAKAAGCGGEA